MSKQLYLLSSILGVLLTVALMLLPTVLLGVPDLVLINHRYTLFLLIIAFWVILDATGTNRAHIHQTHSQRKWLPYLMSAAMLLVLLSSVSERTLGEATPFSILSTIGGGVMIVGVLLRFLAIRTLGDYFLDEVAVVSGQLLVTTGIYSHMRHPSEAGNLCIAFGSVFLLGSLIGLVICTCFLLPIVLIRIRLEDRLLMAHFPIEFRDYMQNLPALLPRFGNRSH